MKEKSKRVEFRIFATQAETVHLSGSFNHGSESSEPMSINFSLTGNGPSTPSTLTLLPTSLDHKTMSFVRKISLRHESKRESPLMARGRGR